MDTSENTTSSVEVKEVMMIIIQYNTDELSLLSLYKSFTGTFRNALKTLNVVSKTRLHSVVSHWPSSADGGCSAVRVKVKKL